MLEHDENVKYIFNLAQFYQTLSSYKGYNLKQYNYGSH
jgi:hypothetical protein